MNDSTYRPVLYTAPPLTAEDETILGEIHRMRKDLRHVLRMPRRWEGGLRRSALARNIQGSNGIEGYEVAEDDAAAAIDGEEPFSGFRCAMAERMTGPLLTPLCYSVLANTGHGSWQPRPDPELWAAFNLRAHHMQAQTVARRVSEAGATWDELERLAARHGLPERALDPMFDAVLGYRVRRGGYVSRAGGSEQMAIRDLTALVSAGVLEARGNGRAATTSPAVHQGDPGPVPLRPPAAA
jgi:hypothetical protein